MFPEFSSSKTLSDFVGDLRDKVFLHQTLASQHIGIGRTTIGRYENAEDRMQAPLGYVATLAVLLCENQSRISDTVWQNGFLSEINQALSSEGKSRVSSWAELSNISAEYLKKLESKRSDTLLKAPQSKFPLPRMLKGRYLPQPRYQFLHGRTGELNEIFKLLADRKTAPVIFIEGPPGNGKTALAREIGERVLVNREWADVLWVSAERIGLGTPHEPNQQLTFEELVKQLVTQVNVSKRGVFGLAEQIKMLQVCFRQRKYLVILDNLDEITDEDVIVLRLLEFIGQSRVLITTRSRKLYRLSRVRGVPLKGLNQKDTTHYLKLEAKRRGITILKKFAKHHFLQIYQITSGVPLLLEWFLQEIQLSTFDRALENLSGQFANRQDLRSLRYSASLLERWKQISLSGKKVWVFLALAIPSTISRNQLESLVPLGAKSLDSVIEELVRHGVMENTSGLVNEEQRVSLHPVIRSFITEGLRAYGMAPKWLRKYYRSTLTSAARGWSALCWKDRKILDHSDERRFLLHLTRECWRYQEFASILLLHEPVSTDLFTMGFLNEYHSFQSMCLEAAKELRKRKLQAQIESELGWAELTRENWELSQRFILSALSYYRRTRNTRWIFITRRYLATISLERGEFKSAKAQYKALLKEIRQTLPRTKGELREALHRQEGIIRDSLGIALRGLGDYAASERELMRALEMVPDGENASLAISRFNLGKTYLQWKHYGKARDQFRQCLELCNKGHYHTTAADALRYLAIEANLRNDSNAALKYAREAGQIYQTLQDTQRHQEVVDLMMRLAAKSVPSN